MSSSGLLQGVVIDGLSVAVPDNVVTNDYYMTEFGEGVEKFAKMTGVERRCIASHDQTASDLAYIAAERLFATSLCRREEVDAIIFVTQTPDYVLPASACVLHSRFGLNTNCIAFDVNLGCSGFVYGLYLAASLLKTGCEHVLLCGGDTNSKIVSTKDKSLAMLFGDGGFAVSIGKDDSSFPWPYSLETNGTGYKSIIVPSGAYRNRPGNSEARSFGEGIIRSDFDLYMNGPDVFSFTISEVPSSIKSLMFTRGISVQDIDYLVLHQANLFVLKQIAKATKFPMCNVPITITVSETQALHPSLSPYVISLMAREME